jgi:hypothetical protein
MSLTILQQLQDAASECERRLGDLPTLIVVILPEYGNDIYAAVKR